MQCATRYPDGGRRAQRGHSNRDDAPDRRRYLAEREIPGGARAPVHPREQALRNDGQTRPQHAPLPSGVVAQERSHSRGIKLRARGLEEMVERLLVRRGATVRPDRSDRVECVGNRDDPRPKRNVRASEAGRIAGPVEPLVMVAHDRR
jgi:hypothetical protein